MYSEKVLDHFSNPRNVGELEDANAVGQVGNAKCGDIMKIYMKIEDDTVKDIKFKTFGCGAAVATSSMATEMVKGKSIDEALSLTNKAVMEALDGSRRRKSTAPSSRKKQSTRRLRTTTPGRESSRTRSKRVAGAATTVTPAKNKANKKRYRFALYLFSFYLFRTATRPSSATASTVSPAPISDRISICATASSIRF